MNLIPASSDRPWMDKTDQRWGYRCLPLTIANRAGWFITNNETVFVTWAGSKDPESLRVTAAVDSRSCHAKSLFGYGILTWKISFLFRTSPGYNLLVRGPANWPKDGISPLEGMVETDWAVQTFTMNWQVTRPHCVVTFAVDEPVCMILPQRRDALEEYRPIMDNIDSVPDLARQYDLFMRSRRAFDTDLQDLRSRSINDYWQGHYFRGQRPDGTSAPEHRTKLILSDFADVAVLSEPSNTPD